jgi:hypothetical protein
MSANGVGDPRRLVRTGMIGRDDKIGEGGCKWRNAAGREDVARPCGASVAGNDLEEPLRSFYCISRRDDTEIGRRRRIAGDADVKYGGAVPQIGAEAYVGGKAVEAQCTAAIDYDGNFRSEPRRQRGVRQRSAQIGSDGAGVENFVDVESGKRIGMDRNSVLSGDCERGDGVGKRRCRRRRQAANLDAAAAGDLDDAVAEFSPGGAKRGECR